MTMFDPVFLAGPKVKSKQPDMIVSSSSKDNTMEGFNILYFIEEEYAKITEANLFAVHLAEIDDNPDMLFEGFGDMVKGTANFFKNLLIKIRDYMKNAWSYIISYVGSFDKFISKHSTLLNKFSGNFKFTGYIYDFTKPIPNLGEVNRIVSEFNSEVRKLDTMTKSEILQRRDEFNSDDAMDTLRGNIIGYSGKVTNDEFADKLKGQFVITDKIDINVDSGVIVENINIYTSVKKILEDARRQQLAIERLLGDLIGFFEKPQYLKVNDMKALRTNELNVDTDNKMIKGSTIDIDTAVSKYELYNFYYSFRAHQFKEISSYVVATSFERIKQLKAQLKQSERIIRQAAFKEGGLKNVSIN